VFIQPLAVRLCFSERIVELVGVAYVVYACNRGGGCVDCSTGVHVLQGYLIREFQGA
jgi:hypothetical protein